MSNGIGRDGKPLKNGVLAAIEIDAVAMLKSPGSSPKAIRERLSARMYLINQGWSVDEINKMRDGEI
jgi:hypothetical protein